MFDLAALTAAVAAHGTVARVVVAGYQGSSPREVGAAMLVWDAKGLGPGQSGTIGGGALEFAAAAEARAILAQAILARAVPPARLSREALGPKLGQCCGGVVMLLTEVYDAAGVAAISGDVVARGVDGTAMPLAVKRILAAARGAGVLPAPGLVQGWMVEPVARPTRQLWVWGAGHVGRAVVAVLAPLPEFAVTWVDVAADRFPADLPEGVTMLPAADPPVLAQHAPPGAQHLILTYSHVLDLALCDALLRRGFARCGLIGSKTKWARFRARLAALGHGAGAIARIDCPIGETALGKHPQAIAIGVAAALLRAAPAEQRQETRA